LNSLLTGPELISDTYLLLFLTQLQREGYSIFIVSGILPNCNADNVLFEQRVVQHEKPRLLSEVLKSKNKTNDSPIDQNKQKRGLTEDEEKELQEVIRMSIESNAEAERRQLEAALALSLEPNSRSINYSTEEEMLDAALKMSLEAL
jgi:ataxin-3